MTEAPAPSPADAVRRILEAALAHRPGECEQLIAAAGTSLPPETLVREFCSPLLREAGDRWERGELSVVQEHLLSSAVRRALSAALDRHNGRAGEPAIAFTTVSGERHEMGSLMLAVICASRGLRALYLGPDLPVGEIGRFCARVHVAAVAISVVTSPAVIDVVGQLRDLRLALPADIPIWIGGQGLGHVDTQHLPDNCHVIGSLQEFYDRLSPLAGGSGN
jgi:methanogenic corrinoid protein MtbC1